MNCIHYAVWHIINNSNVALDGAQPKESMNRPWLCLLASSLLVTVQLPVSECLLDGLSQLHALEFTFFFFKKKKICLCVIQRQCSKVSKCLFFSFSLQDRRCKIGKWMQNTSLPLAICLNKWVHQKAEARLSKVLCALCSLCGWEIENSLCAKALRFYFLRKKNLRIGLFIFTVGYTSEESSPT